ncbi:uncharacterized protein B0H64DRAFT_455625 [Chaetomium fimeti]|uniref:Extracellular membrane protein CFEM domain-containing protein n=1 Tax=Chaetomium fimeti TaxID=1854472 RepID=A0AAE0HPS2_9PEZI|nr:hypothetical protein B0H64DRAFT_455625 [Chaetomium fimeti]
MKAVITILLSLATLAFAAPNPHADIDALATRQEGCTYVCECVDEHGDGVLRSNLDCCQGPTVSEGDTVSEDSRTWFCLGKRHDDQAFAGHNGFTGPQI